MRKQTVTASHGTANSSFFINYNDLQTDGYRDNGEYSRQSALANASLTTAGGNTLSLLANFTRLKAYIPSSINEDDFLNDPTTAAFTWGASRGYESYDRGMLGASYLHNFSEDFTNQTSVFLNFRDAYEPRPFDILKEERVSAGARTRFNWDTSVYDIPSQVSFGAEYYREWYETGTFENLYQEFEDQGSVLGIRLSNNEQDRNYVNFFSQIRLEINDGSIWKPVLILIPPNTVLRIFSLKMRWIKPGTIDLTPFFPQGWERLMKWEEAKTSTPL
jgi:iron complex outermembrane recepter protein